MIQLVRPPCRIFLLLTLFLASVAASSTAFAQASDAERLDRLEAEVAALRQALAALKAEAPPPAPPAPPTAGDARLAELERRLDLIAQDLENLRLGEAAVEASAGEHGLGPAASKIYRTSQGLSIGGYGEMLYQSFASQRDDGAPSGRRDELDFLRAVVYFGYKFDERWLFNSEIEFEHASTDDEGSVSVEFAYLDYLWRPGLAARAGLLLLPMGFVNELHEPPTFLGAKRPDVERVILPTTWRENGLGLFGEAGGWSWRTYLVNGFDASGFSAAGLRGGRQRGSEATAEDFALVGRLDYTGTPGLLAGVSAYVGDSGQGIVDLEGRRLGVATRIVDGHLDWRWRGWQVRALWADARLDDTARLNQALGLGGTDGVAERLRGGYLELGYDLLASRGHEQALVPFLRIETVDTQAAVAPGSSRGPSRDTESFTLGLAYRPIDRLVIKADYQDYHNAAGTAVDQLNLAIGYVF